MNRGNISDKARVLFVQRTIKEHSYIDFKTLRGRTLPSRTGYQRYIDYNITKNSDGFTIWVTPTTFASHAICIRIISKTSATLTVHITHFRSHSYKFWSKQYHGLHIDGRNLYLFFHFHHILGNHSLQLGILFHS